MARYFVESYRPAYPDKGSKIAVHSAKSFSRDNLSPTMTAVFEVDNVADKREAIAVCLEKLAGKNVTVRKIFG